MLRPECETRRDAESADSRKFDCRDFPARSFGKLRACNFHAREFIYLLAGERSSINVLARRLLLIRRQKEKIIIMSVRINGSPYQLDTV